MAAIKLWKDFLTIFKTWGPVGLIILAEPISSTVLLPFVYFMVRSFGYDEKAVGSRAGWITSAFFLAQFPATPAWCLLSDRIGRKPVLLIGLVGTATSLVLFGFSKSLVWAILGRFFGGLICGNGAVARTLIVELAIREEIATSKAFASVGFCTCIGWLAGPLMGGFFIDANALRGSTESLWSQHPFLLPCIAAAAFNLLVFLISIVALPETNQKAQSSTLPQGPRPSDLEREPLISNARSVQEGSPTCTASHGTPKAGDDITSDRLVKAALLLSSGFYFLHIIMFDELFPLFTALSAKTGAGLSFRSRDIASALSCGSPAMVAALLLYPTLQKKMSSVGLWRVTACIFGVVYPIFSLLPKLNGSTFIAKWTLLLALIVARYSTIVVAHTSINVLINETVSASERALMNGLVQSVGSLARMVGPALIGSLWTWSTKSTLQAPLDFHFTFLLLAVVCSFQGLSTFPVIGGKLKTSSRS